MSFENELRRFTSNEFHKKKHKLVGHQQVCAFLLLLTWDKNIERV
ncbi:hypothetical protein FH5_03676 [Priestia endophytica]|nr:hypothetical protein FH5_03676 [Priestia endophytica]